MGDGVRETFAIIVNGDLEPRHLENVRRAIEGLRREDARVKIFVANPEQPTAELAGYAHATVAGLQAVIAGMAGQIDDDDQLVIYTTGHGGIEAESEGCLVLEGSVCVSLATLEEQLGKLSYGRRVVVMDQCYNGSGFARFANDKTTVVTQGSPHETVCCQQFAPFFWSDHVTDHDHDGVVTIWERYIYAKTTGTSQTHSQFLDGADYAVGLTGVLAKQLPFAEKVVDVHTESALREQLKQLQPGQLALVMIGADWCGPCQEFVPKLNVMTKKLHGRFSIIHLETNNADDHDEAFTIMKNLGITATGIPTLAFIDADGRATAVRDMDNPLASLVPAVALDIEIEIQYMRKMLRSGYGGERAAGIELLASLLPQRPRLLAEYLELLYRTAQEAYVPKLPWPHLIPPDADAVALFPQMISALGMENIFRIRDFAREVLEHFPASQAERVVQALAKSYAEIPEEFSDREQIVHALATRMHGDVRLLPQLAAWLIDSSRDMRHLGLSVVGGLTGNLPWSAAEIALVPRLLVCLTDADPLIAELAVQLLPFCLMKGRCEDEEVRAAAEDSLVQVATKNHGSRLFGVAYNALRTMSAASEAANALFKQYPDDPLYHTIIPQQRVLDLANSADFQRAQELAAHPAAGVRESLAILLTGAMTDVRDSCERGVLLLLSLRNDRDEIVGKQAGSALEGLSTLMLLIEASGHSRAQCIVEALLRHSPASLFAAADAASIAVIIRLLDPWQNSADPVMRDRAVQILHTFQAGQKK